MIETAAALENAAANRRLGEVSALVRKCFADAIAIVRELSSLDVALAENALDDLKAIGVDGAVAVAATKAAMEASMEQQDGEVGTAPPVKARQKKGILDGFRKHRRDDVDA